MTNQEWKDTYKPIINPITGDCKNSYTFETYGEEIDYVLSHDNRNVWTEMDGDNGVYIVNGYHLVNRIQYYITEEAWNEGEDIAITVCEYVVCSCYNEDTAEGDPNCDECYGDGHITDWKN